MMRGHSLQHSEWYVASVSNARRARHLEHRTVLLQYRDNLHLDRISKAMRAGRRRERVDQHPIVMRNREWCAISRSEGCAFGAGLQSGRICQVIASIGWHRCGGRDAIGRPVHLRIAYQHCDYKRRNYENDDDGSHAAIVSRNLSAAHNPQVEIRLRPWLPS
jgi:hypothetical protein